MADIKDSAQSHFVIGTAGHIDHGKTVLVKALTGVDTDRLSEEKQRGISIDLGFAPIKLPNGIKASIVDVPGHEKFLKNMLAGATGIDLLLLVVAADDGVMPQTREHLQVADLLENNKAVIAISKIDTVDKKRQAEVEVEIRRLLKPTRFKGAPIVLTSATQRLGLKELLVELGKAVKLLPKKAVDIPWRLPIDRVFTIKGAGTVVTGTLWTGAISTTAAAELLPVGKAVRVRGLQVHNRSTDKAEAGQRLAVNLSGIAKSAITRGDMLVAAGHYRATLQVDTVLKLLVGTGAELKTGVQARLYHGTKETLATIRLLDKRTLKGGATGLARLKLTQPLVAYYRDHFIIRLPNSPRIIGGGTILDSRPQGLSRQDISRTVAELEILASGNPKDIIILIMKRSEAAPLTVVELTDLTELGGAIVTQTVDKLVDAKVIKVINYKETDYYLLQKAFNQAENEVVKYLTLWHRQNPLLPGATKEQLRLNMYSGLTADKFELLLLAMEREGKIALKQDQISLAGFSLKNNKKARAGVEQLNNLLGKEPYSPPKITELDSRLELSVPEVRSLLDTMRAAGEIIVIGDHVFLKTAIEAAQERLVSYLKKNREITVSNWRQLLSTSRKYALPLLEYFDKQGVTQRDGNVRLLKKE